VFGGALSPLSKRGGGGGGGGGGGEWVCMSLIWKGPGRDIQGQGIQNVLLKSCFRQSCHGKRIPRRIVVLSFVQLTYIYIFVYIYLSYPMQKMDAFISYIYFRKLRNIFKALQEKFRDNTKKNAHRILIIIENM